MRPAPRFLAAMALSVALGSCCVAPPRVEKYFSRSTPLGAAAFFRYAVEAAQYEAAYACLLPALQDRISLFRFKSALRWVEPPEWEGITVGEYVIEAQDMWLFREWTDQVNGTPCASVILAYENERNIEITYPVLLCRVGEAWFIDLEKTLLPQ